MKIIVKTFCFVILEEPEAIKHISCENEMLTHARNVAVGSEKYVFCIFFFTL